MIAREGGPVTGDIGLRWSREAVQRLDGALIEGMHVRVEDRDGRAVAVVRCTVGALAAAKLRAHLGGSIGTRRGDG